MALAANYIRKSADIVGVAKNGKATASIIFLHGLGDTGHGWSSTIDEIRPPFMQFNCPTADTMPVTLNLGFQMPSWFDIRTLEVGGSEDEAGIKSAATKVHGMINNEIKAGIPAERIVLGGFSQGGALALYSALTYPEKLAGVIGLSCWLPLHSTFPDTKVCPDTLPVLLCHGDSDPIVSFKFGQLSHSLLKSFLKNTQLKTYRGLAHSASPQEISDMKAFIDQCIPHP
ncbi:hypothetical protein PVAND_005416 [Polypedilum vanderplanki]|uniref:palmitoyl-protein hydrolase n=1 Tax=Polypedilum vanderplanki TaxID=319348 RepID=A0A9J6C0T8_POLVA|nr:hypothetical protein PVAND_005416 [Polypedilum vanderplanki]